MEEIEKIENTNPSRSNSTQTIPPRSTKDLKSTEERTGQDKVQRKDNDKKRKRKKHSKKLLKKLNNVSAEDTLLEIQIRELVGEKNYEDLLGREEKEGEGNDDDVVSFDSGWNLDLGSEIEVEIESLSNLGDGIAISPKKNWVILVPFSVPGDLVRLRIYRNSTTHSLADLIRVIRPGKLRDDELVRCKYFGKCSGCQYQMISYEEQLKIKKKVVENAFKYLSGLDQSQIPVVEDTIPSPLQYGYRTKLTPHFELPRQLKKEKKNSKPQSSTNEIPDGNNKDQTDDKEDEEKDRVGGNCGGYGNNGYGDLSIGLAEKGRRRVLDIEECPIATEVINKKLVSERERIQRTIHDFKRGATLLLRDSLIPSTKILKRPSSKTNGSNDHNLTRTATDTDGDNNSTMIDLSESKDEEIRICVTNHKELTRERVLGKVFEQNAGSFFQNNSSILNSFMNYIIELLSSSSTTTTTTTTTTVMTTNDEENKNDGSTVGEEKVEGERYLVDTYCGSGLFSICLSHHFTKTIGIELSDDSLFYAKMNVRLNGIKNSEFIVGKAESIFKDLDKFESSKTTVIIDPPRKGCDSEFLEQLKRFRPERIIYISCNVHSQARDIGRLIRSGRVINEDEKRLNDGDGYKKEGLKVEEGEDEVYKLERIRGADFFPQTHHCESIALLTLIKSSRPTTIT